MKRVHWELANQLVPDKRMYWVLWLGKVSIYIDSADWWIGYYRGDTNHYACPLPTLVIRWRRARR